MVLYLIAYFSKKMSSAECNYGIGDKELLAIVVCFDKWHIYLHALPKPFTILTDHYNLESFKTKSLLNREQVRWAGELAQYNFTIVFWSGEKNRKADALTCKSEDLPKERDEHA